MSSLPSCGFTVDPSVLPQLVQPEPCDRECVEDKDRCILHTKEPNKDTGAVAAAMEEKSRRIDGIQLEKISSGSELPLSGRTLYAAEFNGADLKEADFTGTRLTNSSFIDATLDSARFDGDSELTGANLTDASLRGTRFPEADLKNSILSGATAFSLECPGAKLMDADLSEANLEDATFTGANLRGATLANAVLRRADFIGCNLEDANLAETDLRDCSLVLSMLKDADIRDVNADHRTNLGESITERERACLAEVDNSLPGLGYRVNPETIPDLYGRCWYELRADTSPEQLEPGRLNSGQSILASSHQEDRPENIHGSIRENLKEEIDDEADTATGGTQRAATNLVSDWPRRFKRKFQYDTEEVTEQLEIASHVYRDYQRIFNENHLSRKHRIYRIRQGHAHRKHQLAAGHFGSWWKATISRLTFLYGESPRQVVLCSGFLIAAFAGIYPFFGIESPAGDQFQYQLTTNIDAEAFYAAIQLSIGQFFRTSTGGYTPIGVGTLLGQLQLVIGTVFISLFIFTLGRRATK